MANVDFGAMRAFQSVNLLEFGGVLVSEYDSLTNFESLNLLTNFGARSSTSTRSPYIGYNSVSSFRSCRKADVSKIPAGTPFSFTMKFESEAFVTSVLLTQDTYSKMLGSETQDDKDN